MLLVEIENHELLNATRRRGLTLALPNYWAEVIPYRPEEEKVHGKVKKERNDDILCAGVFYDQI